MTRATFTIAVVFLCIAAAAPEVIFVSPCECQGFHGKNRWVTKTDLSPVPSDKSAIQSVTPSQIYGWEGLGPDVLLTGTTEARMPSEQKWYALTGRIVDAKVEADGDIHIGGFGYPYYRDWYPSWGWSVPYAFNYGYYSYGYNPSYGYDYDYYSDSAYGYGDRSSIAQLQRRLARAGYYYGAIDGVMGPQTRRAIRAYERASGALSVR